MQEIARIVLVSHMQVCTFEKSPTKKAFKYYKYINVFHNILDLE